MSHPDLTNQEKLEEVYKLALENNEMLHRMQNRLRLGVILRVIYWLAILGALGGVYYYIRPIINVFAVNSEKTQGIFQQFEELRSQFPETKALQQFLKQIRSDDLEIAPATTTE